MRLRIACEVPVYSVTDARRHLGADCPMTDKEIEAMLNQFRQIAMLALDAVSADKARSEQPNKGTDL